MGRRDSNSQKNPLMPFENNEGFGTISYLDGPSFCYDRNSGGPGAGQLKDS